MAADKFPKLARMSPLQTKERSSFHVSSKCHPAGVGCNIDCGSDPGNHGPAGDQRPESRNGLADVQSRPGGDAFLTAQADQRHQCFEAEARLEHAVSSGPQWCGSRWSWRI